MIGILRLRSILTVTIPFLSVSISSQAPRLGIILRCDNQGPGFFERKHPANAQADLQRHAQSVDNKVPLFVMRGMPPKTHPVLLFPLFLIDELYMDF